MSGSEGKMVCEKPIPHVHRFPTRRNDGQKPINGDIAQCVCGRYAISKDWEFGEYWQPISARRALRKMRKAGCINGGRSE